LRAGTSQPLAYGIDPGSLSAAELELLDKLEREFTDRATGEHNSVRLRAPSQTRSETEGAPCRRRKSPRPRKSRERDRRDHLAMNGLAPRNPTKAVSPSVPTPIPLHIASSTPSSAPTNTPPTKRRRADQRDRRPLAAWRYAGDLSRMAAATRALSELDPHAFTLNLGREIEEAARMRPDGPLVYLQERLFRSLRRQVGHVPPFAFVLETTASGRLHVHGVIAISGAPEALRRALTQAGGLWDGAGAEYQLDLQPVWDGDGWSRYCGKDAARTRRALGVKRVLSLSRDLSRMARDYWATLRASQRARRSAARGNFTQCSLVSVPAVMPVSASSDAPRETLVSARVPDCEVSAPAGIVNLATTGPSSHLEHEMAMTISVNRPVHRRNGSAKPGAQEHHLRLSKKADKGVSLPGVNSGGRRLHIRSHWFTSPRQRSSPRSQARDDSYSGSSARRGSPANLGLAYIAGPGTQIPPGAWRHERRRLPVSFSSIAAVIHQKVA